MVKIKKFGISGDEAGDFVVSVKFDGFENVADCDKFLRELKLKVEGQTTLENVG